MAPSSLPLIGSGPATFSPPAAVGVVGIGAGDREGEDRFDAAE